METRLVQAKYKFTEPEKREIAEKLAQRQMDLNIADDERKSIMASANDKVKRIKLDIQTLSRNYRDGYELRSFECNVIMDYKKREKIFKDAKTGDMVDRQPFGPGDEQRSFA